MQNKQTDLPETCDICGEAFDSNDRCACFSTIIEDELDFPPCPVCGGEPTPLGTLGNLLWFRCSQCGIDFYVGG